MASKRCWVFGCALLIGSLGSAWAGFAADTLPTALSEKNRQWVQGLLTADGVHWSVPEVHLRLDAIALQAQQCQSEASETLARLEAQGAEAQAMNGVIAQKTACQTDRDEALRALVLPSSAQALEQWLRPARPAVLHFGIHDRMKCGVCIPSASGPITELP